jgi:hypothetical protein
LRETCTDCGLLSEEYARSLRVVPQFPKHLIVEPAKVAATFIVPAPEKQHHGYDKNGQTDECLRPGHHQKDAVTFQKRRLIVSIDRFSSSVSFIMMTLPSSRSAPDEPLVGPSRARYTPQIFSAAAPLTFE